MTLQFSPYQIISALDRLGIKHDGNQPNSKGWLPVLCPNPLHNDHNYGNCSINLNSGFVKCFRCGYGDKGDAKGIINIVMDNCGYTFKQAKQFIEEGLYTTHTQTKIEVEKPKRKRERPLYNFTSIDFNPDNFYYTRQRGITKEFVDTFKIKHAVSGWFNDYFIIPIVDSSKGINEYEARRLKEYEVLCNFYNVEGAPYYKLKQNFELLCEHNHIRLNRKTFEVMIDTTPIQDDRLLYLLKPKTLYLADSRCQETIWNIDNLNYDEDLYLTEGIASCSRIWTDISKNVSSMFGVSITELKDHTFPQIDYLKKFKRVIYIPDYDKAGYDSVDKLRHHLKNLSICDNPHDDTDKKYTNYIINNPFIKPEEYLTKYFHMFRLIK